MFYMRRLQVLVGIVMVLAFLATGAYMDRSLKHLRGMADGQRMVYRACHINLLLIGAYCVAAGARREKVPIREQYVEGVAALLTIAAAALALWAFVREPLYANLYRPWTRMAVYATFTSVILRATIYFATEESSSAES
jgi:hydrogenase-4 membrane subunit HyfE